MLHRHRADVTMNRRGAAALIVAVVLVLLSACKTAPDIAPTPESLPLPSDASLYLFLAPKSEGDLAYVLLEGFDVDAMLVRRIEIAGIAIAAEDGAALESGSDGAGSAPGSGAGRASAADAAADADGGAMEIPRGVVVALRGDIPTKRLGRALKRSDEWQRLTDAQGREYFRQLDGPWLLLLPSDGLLVLGNDTPEKLPGQPPIVPPWPRDFSDRISEVPLAAFVPSPGGGAVPTPLGGVLPLQELRFYVDEDPEAAEALLVRLRGEAVLDTERSARAFEVILRLLALGIAAELEMEPGRIRELLTVEQRGNLVAFSAGPLESDQLTALASELVKGYGGGGGLPGVSP